MKQLNLNIILALSLFALLACDANEFDPNTTDVVIIEAYLYEGEPVTNVKVSQLIPFVAEEDASYAINDAEISIIWNDQHYPLTLSPGDSGYYHYPGTELEVKIGETYRIELEYFGKLVSATTTVPPGPEGLVLSGTQFEVPPIESFFDLRNRNIENIEIYWDNNDASHHYVLIENIEDNPSPVDVNNILGEFRRGNFQLITRPTNLDVYNVRGQTLDQYGTYRVKLFKVNQEYVDLYETSEQDSRSLNEPLSNVENGLGIFTSFSYDAVFFEVIKP
ncbi:DUF4249 family protein [Fulvivirgaceae bacterium BMA10]|uniref:DUF4249 family protein n=1 Tax=Splendidivirga corallicola TaxID=3051826 RepID=A0ABT8KQC4_9BACT|nr:DUF4249 family protein [Fulvivirgaceae bacterium BMA10]